MPKVIERYHRKAKALILLVLNKEGVKTLKLIII